VYELARTVKNDWLHHRFTMGWAEVVRQLGIEIGDLLVFERWTQSRTLLHMTIKKERLLRRENSEYSHMTRAERLGQF
jgi:phosphoglycerate-specific signal transduction histidine kinase